MHDERLHYLEAGMVEVIAKPFDMNAFRPAAAGIFRTEMSKMIQ